MTVFYQAPVHTIASNAGFDGALVLGKLLEQDNHHLGFDAAKGPSLTPLTTLMNVFSICSPLVLSLHSLSLFPPYTSLHSSLENQIHLQFIGFRRG